MKKSLTVLLLALPLMAYAQQESPADSISATLDEVVITAESRLETAKKVTLRPSRLDKKHSTNGYALLENMNLPDFIVNASTKSISMATGRDVITLVNGTEVTPDELATLAASEILQIDYQRNPGGRYVGSGAVLNFITVQHNYGGNIYLSANEGLARQHGNYIAMGNYKKNALTLTLTANGKWDNTSIQNSSHSEFMLNDGTLNQTVTPAKGATHTNSQYVNLKLAHTARSHSFDISLALTRSATPENIFQENISYSGLLDFASTVTRRSTERGVSPVLKIHYNLQLPGGHTIMAIATARHGHTNYRSNYLETAIDRTIQTRIVENNLLASATAAYFKQFSSGLSLGTSIDEYYNFFRDLYSGSFTNRQTLTNNHAMAMLHLDHNLPFGLSYYLSAGITDLYSTIGNHRDNQFSPKAFYGATYSINSKQSLSITGNYVHSIYRPSDKNDAVIPTSFFEASMGNPELKQMNAFQNLISYNGHFGHFGVSFTHDFLKYFNNTSYRYFVADNIIYRQLINDGNFSYNKLIFGTSANLINSKLRLKANATFSINRFDSRLRPARSNDWRADFNASYIFGDWQIRTTYLLPYSVLGTEGIKTRNPAQYALTINWQRGNWAAECSIENFLSRRMATNSLANYPIYRSTSKSLSDRLGRNISISLTYTLSYGKKTAPDRPETESTINSAILRPF